MPSRYLAALLLFLSLGAGFARASFRIPVERVISAASAPGWGEDEPAISPHEEALERFCPSCHGDDAADGSALLPLTSSMCTVCHRLDFLPSHPLEVVPSMPMPDGFPLSADGTLTCVTCHDPHGADRNFLRGGPFQPRFLDLFCHHCHTPSAGEPHAGTFVVAHQKRTTPRIGEDTVDYVSQRCMECHDGVFGPEASIDLTGSSSTMLRGLGGSHKIGLDYNVALGDPSRRRLDLRPDVSEQISFYEGKVGCLSCHNLYSDLRYLTTVTIRRDALCLACHDK